ncbi:hypothetical protein DIURU_002054 [Diutina rugosa]|uniref:sphinganine-1-phosphate aldolase n=1 Tax=Diutina rugosa TaxID=5481 RepID=A0A642URW5_DIURU|nr:uncharacterized protein DIURU_002054 [Diutina rugosa]KAA8904102.1 hypothetical protein DIURU_002054 [Diutina rugosa]
MTLSSWQAPVARFVDDALATNGASVAIALRQYVVAHYLIHGWWGYANLLRDIVLLSMASRLFQTVWTYVYGYGPVGSAKMAYNYSSRRFFAWVLSLPPIKSKVDKQVSEAMTKVEAGLIKNDDSLLQLHKLPTEGLPVNDIDAELDKLANLEHTDYLNGRVSGAVYHGGDELLALQTRAYEKYSVANQLHPDVFPGVRKMEAEVVSMVLRAFNAPETGVGCTTSGGTESLLLAGLAAREYGKRYKGITRPEIIAPVTIHAGIEKACYYFGMTLHKVDLNPKTYQVDVAQVKRLINGNTVLLCGSTPNYPHGVMDDIEALGELATKYNIPLHVDACLGSFIVSFLSKSKVHGDKKLPITDFRVPGVTSISCDTHKYGFAPKGSSIIMYRSHKMRECQYYVSTDWTGGLYGSPTLAGSRPGALMVGCWATMLHMGEDGYTKLCYEIVSTAMKFRTAIETHPTLSKYLEVIGNPLGSVVAFKTKTDNVFNIYDLSDDLSHKGWHYATLQNPPALHFAFTRLTVPIIDELIQGVVDSVEKLAAASDGKRAKPRGDTGSFYGVAGSVSTTGVADRLIVGFLDALYKQ